MKLSEGYRPSSEPVRYAWGSILAYLLLYTLGTAGWLLWGLIALAVLIKH